VRHTVGALLQGKQPGERGVGGKGTPLRVLDPACGSGSFLLGAYQYLLDWYRDGYVAAGVEKWARSRTPGEQNLLRRQIEAADREIDSLVYTPYGLTGEEIRLVEGR
jgi:type I restriction-modification system DNA methylase subunit